MKILILSLLLGLTTLAAEKNSSSSSGAGLSTSIYDIKVKDIEGKDVSLSKYKGEVLLIVNTASQCGYTPQLKDLEDLYTRYHKEGFEVLAFPSNDFRQDSGSPQDSQKFAQEKYQITFPMFDKNAVRGDKKQELYKFLVRKAPSTNVLVGDEVAWNFEKFLVDRQGQVVGRYRSPTKPSDKDVVAAIEKALHAK